MNIYRNKEAKKYLILMSIFAVGALLVMAVATYLEWQYFTHMEVQALAEYPDVYALTGKYGMQEDILLVSDIIKMRFGMIICNVSLLVIGEAVMIFFFCRYLMKRTKQLDILCGYMEQIAMGQYTLDLADNSEDELSNLKNELYKITLSLKEQAEHAREQKRALADSVSDISHQLKTPLTSISVLLDNLNEQEQMAETVRQKFLQEITHQITLVNWLIVAMLKLSRLDAGVVEFEREPVSLVTLLQEVIDNLELLAELRDIRLVVRLMDVKESKSKLLLPTDEQAEENQENTEHQEYQTYSLLANYQIMGDYNWNREAISNIVKNAIEHSIPGTTVEITLQDNNVYTAIAISNQGAMISKEDQKHIFDRFYRTSQSPETSIGIGLALAKAIIDQQNGYLSVSSGISAATITEPVNLEDTAVEGEMELATEGEMEAEVETADAVSAEAETPDAVATQGITTFTIKYMK